MRGTKLFLSRAHITWCCILGRAAPPVDITALPSKALTIEHAICIHGCSWETAFFHAEVLAVLQSVERLRLLLATKIPNLRHGRAWRRNTAATHVELAPPAPILLSFHAVSFAIDATFGGPVPDFVRGTNATRNIADASRDILPTIRPATTGKAIELVLAPVVTVLSSDYPAGASREICLLGGGREDLESDEKGGDELHC